MRTRVNGKGVLLFAVCLVAAAAGCDATAVSPDQLGSAGQALIEPGECHVPEDLDLVESSLWLCSDSTACPCGSRCEFGRCVFDCRSDAECAGGEVCDELGRCSPATASPIDELPPSTRQFSVSPASIELSARGARRLLSVTAGPAQLPQVVVSADAGALIECDPTQVGAGSCACTGPTECTVTSLPAGATRRMWVSIPTTTALPATPTWSVRVSSQTIVETVPVTVLPASGTIPRDGHYQGAAVLVDTGLGTSIAAAGLAGKRITVEADVRASKTKNLYDVVLTAPSGLLGADGRMHGTITCSLSSCTWTLSSRAQADDVALPLLGMRKGQPVTIAGGTLAGTVVLDIEGPVTGVNAARIQLRLQLQRIGAAGLIPAAPGAPTLPTSADLLPWEQTMVEASSSQVTQNPTQYDAMALGWASVACYLYYAGELGWPQDEANELCDLTGKWMRGWRSHVEALQSSGGTSLCEWNGPLPINFVPCTYNDIMYGGCDGFIKDYNCAPGSYTDANGKLWDGCYVSYNANQVTHKPLQCAQRYACAATPDLDQIEELGLDPAVMALGDLEFTTHKMSNGDLKCGPARNNELPASQARLPQAFPYFANLNLPQPLRPYQMLQGCLVDLLDEPQKEVPVAELLQHEGCLDLARATRAAGWAGEIARGRAAVAKPPVPTAEDLAADALFMRLIQEWLETQTFVAREGLEEHTMASVIRVNPADAFAAAAAAVPELDALIEVQRRGWAAILHPRMATALAYVNDKLLPRPDYRRQAFDVDRAGEQTAVAVASSDQQAFGVPVTMLEAGAAYLELVEADLEAAWRSSDPLAREVALARARVAFRQMLAAEALAAGTLVRARAAGTVTWETAYKIAQARFAAAFARAVAMAEAASGDGNPLGVSGDDLPVYFFDPVGSVNQYFAMSLYLLPLAQAAWPQAETHLTTARNAWQSWRSQTWGDLLQDMSDTRRRADVKERYGRTIQELCGVKGATTAVNVLDTWMDVNQDGVPDVAPEVCHLTQAASCSAAAYLPTAQTVLDQAADEDRRVVVCMATQNRKIWGSLFGLPQTPMERLTDFLSRRSTFINDIATATITRDASGNVTFTGAGQTFVVPRAEFFTYLQWPANAKTVAACQEAFPRGERFLLADRADNPMTKPDCFQGRLGQLHLAVQSQIKIYEQARSQLNDQFDRYRTAMDGCFLIHDANQQLAAARQAYANTVTELQQLRSAVSGFGNFFSGVVGMIGNAFIPMGLGAPAAFGSVLSPFFSNVTNDINDKIERATIYHQNTIAHIQGQLQESLCFNAAEQHLIGMQTAALAIDRAWIDLARVTVELSDAQDAVRAAVRDGRAAVQREYATVMPNLAHEHWIDESVEYFQRQMRWARRLAYLTARAVEFETQQSLAVSEEILRATHPYQLRDALNVLTALIGPQGTGARPQTRVMSFSLCAYLGAEASEQPFTGSGSCDVNELRRRLADPAYAVYDAAGVYKGQRIPFTLRPFGVYAQADCAERLWGIAAYVRGASAFRGFMPVVDIQLHQQNTFASQWCDANPDGDLQVASTRPCNNLMLEQPLSSAAASCGADDYAIARVTALPNNGNPGFDYDVNYQPATTELAGRGVYGEWALFIPESVLFRGSRTSGLDLGEVEDVVIRFSYNSLAQ